MASLIPPSTPSSLSQGNTLSSLAHRFTDYLRCTFHHKSIKITSILLVIVLLSGIIFHTFQSTNNAQGATYTFGQTSWTGGTSGTTATHPTDSSGWNKYTSQTNTDTTTISGSATSASFSSTAADTFTATTNKDTGTTTATWDTSGALSVPAGVWSSMAQYAGPNSAVNALAFDSSGNLYLGGAFTSIGNLVTGSIAKWNPSTSEWSAVGTGLTGTIYALKFDSSGNLYVAGQFTDAGGITTADNIVKWNPGTSTWSALGTGATATVNTLEFDSVGNLYAGGNFASVGGVSNTSGIGKWNGSAWSAVGTGTSGGMVNAVAFDVSDNMYIGGTFTAAGGVASTGKIAKWNGSAWSAVGTGLNSTVNAFAIDTGGNIYVGGSFSDAGGDTTADDIAKWNGSAWSGLGATAKNSSVNFLLFDSAGDLYVGAHGTLSGGLFSGGMSKWSVGSSTWTNPVGGASPVATSASDVNSLAFDSNGVLYAGGSFPINGATAAWRNIAKWNGTAWSALTSVNTAPTGDVSAAVVASNGDVYIAGAFAGIGMIANTKYVAKWSASTSTWSALGTGVTNGTASSLAFDSSGNLYVGGSFTGVGGVSSTARIAKWNGTAWSALSTGISNGTVLSLAFDSSGNLYVGGSFTDVGGDTNADRFIKWNGSAWSAVGTGLNSTVNAIAIDTGGNAYAGGNFTDAGGDTAADNIAKWNGSAWSAVGTGLNSTVNILKFDSSGNLYAGGGFTDAGSANGDYIAKWNGTAWSALGTGTTSAVTSINVDSSNNVYTGGNFTTIGGTSAARIAKWNGTTWSALGTGANSTVSVIAVDSSNNIYAGGGFTIAGGVASPTIAKYTQTTTAIAQSLAVDSTTEPVWTATLTKNDTPGTGVVTYYVSNDGGSTFNQITPGANGVAGTPYTFPSVGTSDFRFKITMTGTATVQDVSFAYGGRYTTSSLISSKFDAVDATNLVAKIAWTESGTTAGRTIKFQLRSSPDGNTWSGWCGYSDSGSSCSGTNYFVTANNNVTLDSGSPLRSGNDDRYFQYQLLLASDGAGTAQVDDVTVSYVVNAPPDLQNVTALQNADGTVTISYDVRDTDTSTGTLTPGFVTPTFQYWDGSTYQAITTLASGNTDNKAVTGSYTTYTATWTPTTDYPNHFQNGTAKVKVIMNDNEAANNTTSVVSSLYTLDTTAPSGSNITVDGRVTPVALTLTATDDSALQVKYSGDSGLVDASYVSYPVSSPTYNSSSDPVTVYAKYKDAYGNSTSILSATTPETPTAVSLLDTSNLKEGNSDYRLFLSWKTVALPTAGFGSYKIFRTSDTNSWSSTPLATVSTRTTNYYADQPITGNTQYYYRVLTYDANGSISRYSEIVSGNANGAQDLDESGGGGPTISNTLVTYTTSNTATVLWDTNTLSNSVVGYSTSPSTFSSSVTMTSLNDNADGSGRHSVVLSNLTPNTTYYVQVNSVDPSGQSATDNNGGQGYAFTTGAGPSISHVTSPSITPTTATVTWTTDIASTSTVYYSTNADLSSPTSVVDPTASTTHSVSLTNLTAGTQYYYYVSSTDENNNTSTDKHVVNGTTEYYTLTTDAADTTPPTISNVEALLTSNTSAVISWDTNEDATAQVYYGLDNSFTSNTTATITYTKKHVVTLNDLTNKTNYLYKVISTDAYGNSTTDDNDGAGYPFSTSETPGIREITREVSVGGGIITVEANSDKSAPNIQDLKVNGITKTSATVTWTTDEDANSLVRFGQGDSMNTITGSENEFTKTHSVALSTLAPGIPYKLKAISFDHAGNRAESDSVGFTTTEAGEVGMGSGDSVAEQTPVEPLTAEQQSLVDAVKGASTNTLSFVFSALKSNPNIAALSESLFLSNTADIASKVVDAPRILGKQPTATVDGDTVTIQWVTDKPTNTSVQYGSTTDLKTVADGTYPFAVSSPEADTTDHKIVITNLRPATTYHFRALSKASIGPEVRSDDQIFVTSSQLPVVTDFKVAAIDYNSATLSWKTNVPTSSTIQMTDDDTKKSGTQGDVTLMRDHTFVVENLKEFHSYTVRVRASDEYNNVALGDYLTFKTVSDTKSPEISKVTSDSALYSGSEQKVQTIVSWETTEPSTSQVFYQEGADGKADVVSLPLNSSLDTKHITVVTKFKPATVYKFWVESSDHAGNTIRSQAFTILTPQESKTVVDLILNNFEQTFGWTKNLRF